MKASTQKKTERVGLAANGASGAWDISINETLRGKEKWYADIEGPSVYLSFQLVDVDVLNRMIAFFDRGTSTDANSVKTHSDSVGEELTIGSFGQAPVVLIKDNEYEDRFFLVVGPKSGCCARFPLWSEDAQMILNALRQVRKDLAG